MVIGTAVVPPRRAEFGLIKVIVGPFTVNVGAPVVEVVPPGVVTVTGLVETVAVVVIVQVEVAEVPPAATTGAVQVTPAAPRLTAVAPVRFVPVIVIGTTCPR